VSSRVRAAANLAQARRKMPRYQAATRDDVAYAQDSARKAHVVLGWCSSCGVYVTEDGLHARDCCDVPIERRRR